MSYTSTVSSKYSLPRSSTSYGYSTKPSSSSSSSSSITGRSAYEPRDGPPRQIYSLSDIDFTPPAARRSLTYPPKNAYEASSTASRKQRDFLDHDMDGMSTLSKDTVRPDESVSQVSSYASRGRSRGSSRSSSAKKQMTLYQPQKTASVYSSGSARSSSGWGEDELPYWDELNQCNVRDVVPSWVRRGQ